MVNAKQTAPLFCAIQAGSSSWVFYCAPLQRGLKHEKVMSGWQADGTFAGSDGVKVSLPEGERLRADIGLPTWSPVGRADHARSTSQLPTTTPPLRSRAYGFHELMEESRGFEVKLGGRTVDMNVKALKSRFSHARQAIGRRLMKTVDIHILCTVDRRRFLNCEHVFHAWERSFLLHNAQLQYKLAKQAVHMRGLWIWARVTRLREASGAIRKWRDGVVKTQTLVQKKRQDFLATMCKVSFHREEKSCLRAIRGCFIHQREISELDRAKRDQATAWQQEDDAEQLEDYEEELKEIKAKLVKHAFARRGLEAEQSALKHRVALRRLIGFTSRVESARIGRTITFWLSGMSQTRSETIRSSGQSLENEAATRKESGTKQFISWLTRSQATAQRNILRRWLRVMHDENQDKVLRSCSLLMSWSRNMYISKIKEKMVNQGEFLQKIAIKCLMTSQKRVRMASALRGIRDWQSETRNACQCSLVKSVALSARLTTGVKLMIRTWKNNTVMNTYVVVAAWRLHAQQAKALEKMTQKTRKMGVEFSNHLQAEVSRLKYEAGLKLMSKYLFSRLISRSTIMIHRWHEATHDRCLQSVYDALEVDTWRTHWKRVLNLILKQRLRMYLTTWYFRSDEAITASRRHTEHQLSKLRIEGRMQAKAEAHIRQIESQHEAHIRQIESQYAEETKLLQSELEAASIAEAGWKSKEVELLLETTRMSKEHANLHAERELFYVHEKKAIEERHTNALDVVRHTAIKAHKLAMSKAEIRNQEDQAVMSQVLQSERDLEISQLKAAHGSELESMMEDHAASIWQRKMDHDAEMKHALEVLESESLAALELKTEEEVRQEGERWEEVSP